jgi:hypothetical protein
MALRSGYMFEINRAHCSFFHPWCASKEDSQGILASLAVAGAIFWIANNQRSKMMRDTHRKMVRMEVRPSSAKIRLYEDSLCPAGAAGLSPALRICLASYPDPPRPRHFHVGRAESRRLFDCLALPHANRSDHQPVTRRSSRTEEVSKPSRLTPWLGGVRRDALLTARGQKEGKQATGGLQVVAPGEWRGRRTTRIRL